MSTRNDLNSGRAAAAGDAPGTAFNPLSPEATRTLILHSRAIATSEARLAAAIDRLGREAGPAPQSRDREDAIELPPRSSTREGESSR